MSKLHVFSELEQYFDEMVEKPFQPGVSYIPVAQQSFGVEEAQNVVDAILSGRLAAGPYAQAFEQELPKYFGRTTRALLVNSGSSANLVAVSALGLKPGDEVITAACGFPTTVNPIVQNGATPVFIDVDKRTLNASLKSIQNARTSKTKAVVLAHTLGNPFRADQVAAWCKEEGIALVEDCCDAFGSQIGGKACGSFGDYATCSFYPAHHISMGEGGAVLSGTGRNRLACESLRDWGRDCWCDPGCDNTCGKRFTQQHGALPAGYDHKYTYSKLGYNLKATELQAAVGVAQLGKVKRFITARQANWVALKMGVMESAVLSKHLTPVEPTEDTVPSWFGFPVHLDPRLDRAKLLSFLESRKVGSRLVFAGNLTKQPAYQGVKFRVHGELDNTDFIMRHTFWLGVHPGLGEAHTAYMLEQLEAGIKEQL